MAPSIALSSDQAASTIRSTLSNPTAITLLVLSLWVCFVAFRVLSDPLRSIPGPLSARFTRLWELNQHRKGNFEKVNIALHKKYGPVVRLAPGRYSIADRASIKQIYGHGKGMPKSNFYLAWTTTPQPITHLFGVLDNATHSAARRKVAQMYSMSTLISYEKFVDNANAVLMSKLDLFSDNNQSFDVPTWMQYYAFDVIGEITVGKSFGMMERGYDSLGVMKALDMQTTYSSHVALVPEWHPRIMWLLNKVGASNGIQPLIDFVQERVGERKVGKTSSDRSDFLTKLLAMRENGKIEDYDMTNTIGNNVIAGSDTTAVSLSSILYNLHKNPQCLNKLREEIENAAAEDKISDPITFKEAQELPYLQAVIKEAIRVHPATGQIMARLVPAGGADLLGHYFPEGTCVGANSWVVHQMPEIFGDDADIFNPERWFGEKENVTMMNENLFSFGSGARTCIGKNISLLEMSKVIPQILRRFEVELVGSGEWETKNVWFVKQKFDAKVRKRVA